MKTLMETRTERMERMERMKTINKEKPQLTETQIKTKYSCIYTYELFEEVVRKIKRAIVEKSEKIIVSGIVEDDGGELFEEVTEIYIEDIITVESTYIDEYGIRNRKIFGDSYF